MSQNSREHQETEETSREEIAAFSIQPGGVGYIALVEPVECACGRMVYFVVNRLGKSRCIECDSKFRVTLSAKE